MQYRVHFLVAPHGPRLSFPNLHLERKRVLEGDEKGLSHVSQLLHIAFVWSRMTKMAIPAPLCTNICITYILLHVCVLLLEYNDSYVCRGSVTRTPCTPMITPHHHGVAMHIIKALVKAIHKLEIDLGLPKNTIMHKLTARLHILPVSSSLDSKHTTLMDFTHQCIVFVFETLTTPDKKGRKQSPIVDAGDVQKHMLVLQYVLDGLADELIVQHNARLAPANHVVDPFPDAIMAINEWLHWYDTNIYIYIHAYSY
jgi:hypothetical protein